VHSLPSQQRHRRAALVRLPAVALEQAQRLGLEQAQRLGLEQAQRLGLEQAQRLALGPQLLEQRPGLLLVFQ
jgi:flagellar biosynthesis/type III secretory pathway protein FliH